MRQITLSGDTPAHCEQTASINPSVAGVVVVSLPDLAMRPRAMRYLVRLYHPRFPARLMAAQRLDVPTSPGSSGFGARRMDARAGGKP
jgi:hypothetical protein